MCGKVKDASVHASSRGNVEEEANSGNGYWVQPFERDVFVSLIRGYLRISLFLSAIDEPPGPFYPLRKSQSINPGTGRYLVR
jgi:hypothetical protein